LKIFLTLSVFKFNSSAISRTLNRLSDRTDCRTISTFAQLRWVFGCRGLSSSFMLSRPLFKPFMPLKYARRFQCFITISHSEHVYSFTGTLPQLCTKLVLSFVHSFFEGSSKHPYGNSTTASQLLAVACSYDLRQ
jgi:hypothetical protein